MFHVKHFEFIKLKVFKSESFNVSRETFCREGKFDFSFNVSRETFFKTGKLSFSVSRETSLFFMFLGYFLILECFT